MMPGGDLSAHRAHHRHWQTEVVLVDRPPPALRKTTHHAPVPPAATPHPAAGPWLRTFGLKPPSSAALYRSDCNSMLVLEVLARQIQIDSFLRAFEFSSRPDRHCTYEGQTDKAGSEVSECADVRSSCCED